MEEDDVSSATAATSNSSNNVLGNFRVVHQDGREFTVVAKNTALDLDYSNWAEQNLNDRVKSVVPNDVSGVRIFLDRETNNLVAAQLALGQWDAKSGAQMLQNRAPKWQREYADEGTAKNEHMGDDESYSLPEAVSTALPTRGGPVAEALEPTAAGGAASASPSLLNLLTKLSDPAVTTPDQRFAIRGIISDYLNNEITHVKVFAYLSQVLGQNFLSTLIGELTVSNGEDRHFSTKISPSKISTPEIAAPAAAPATSLPPISEKDAKLYRAALFRAIVNNFRWILPHESQLESLSAAGARAVSFPRSTDQMNEPPSVAFVGGIASAAAQVESAPPDMQSPRLLPSVLNTTAEETDNSTTRTSTDREAAEALAVDAPGTIEEMADERAERAVQSRSVAERKMLNASSQKMLNASQKMVMASAPAPTEAAGTEATPFNMFPVLDCSTLKCSVAETFNPPPPAAGHAALAAHFSTGPAIVVFGGGCVNKHDGVIHLYNSLWALDEEIAEWILLDKASVEKPPPRFYHASALVMKNGTAYDSTNTMRITTGEASIADVTGYLIAFGGVGSSEWSKNENLLDSTSSPHVVSDTNLILLDDLWVFNFDTGQWKQVVVGGGIDSGPIPRMGCSFAVAKSNCLILYGGVGNNRTASHLSNATFELPVPATARTVLSDTWALSWSTSSAAGVAAVTGDSVDGTYPSPGVIGCSWSRVNAVAPNRAFYGATALTFITAPASASGEFEDCIWNLGDGRLKSRKMSDWATHRVILLVSGIVEGGDKTLSETPGCLLGLVLAEGQTSSVEILWRFLPELSCVAGHMGGLFRGRANPNVCSLEFRALTHVESSCHSNLSRFAMGRQAAAPSVVAERGGLGDGENLLSKGLAAEAPFELRMAPGLLVQGGFEIARGEKCDDLWILRLSNLNPTLLPSVTASAEQRERELLTGVILSGCATTPELAKFLESIPVSAVPRISSTAALLRVKSAELGLFRQVWHHPCEDYEAEILQTPVCINSGILWALASLVEHPFSCIGHLLQNSVEAKAKNVHINFEQWLKRRVLTITDDGDGLSCSALHQITRGFGSQTNFMKPSAQNSAKFGLGFKFALSRLAYNALVLTHSTNILGVALLSVPLNKSFLAASVIAPVCCWSTHDGLPVCAPSEEAAFGQSLNTILRNSPLGSMQTLENELLKFKDELGTRIIFFGLREDVTSINFDGTLQRMPEKTTKPPSVEDATTSLFAWLPQGGDCASCFARGPAQDLGGTQGYRTLTMEPFGWEVTVTAAALPDGYSPGTWRNAVEAPDYYLPTYMAWSQLHTAANLRFNGIEILPSDRVSSNNALQDSTLAGHAANDVGVADELMAEGTTESSSISPVPPPPAKSAVSPVDNFKRSIWRHLQRKLYYSLELPYLFSPSYGDQEFYGIIGFLNDIQLLSPELSPSSSVEIRLSSDPGSRDEKPAAVCEAGVLLYHCGRLINRALLSIPAPPEWLRPVCSRPTASSNVFTEACLTAVIHMPSFLLSRATKEGFVQEKEPIFQHFYDRLERVLKEYLAVFADAEQLDALRRRYRERFDKCRYDAWQGRRRRRVAC